MSFMLFPLFKEGWLSHHCTGEMTAFKMVPLLDLYQTLSIKKFGHNNTSYVLSAPLPNWKIIPTTFERSTPHLNDQGK